MKHKKFYLLIAAIVLLPAGAFIGLKSAYTPVLNGYIALPGLEQQVTVHFDQFASPEIYAASKTDAYFTLGYLTARERLFQMDLMRRKISGRLAEVFGGAALSSDINNRHLGFEQVAKDIVSAIPPPHRAVLQAYVEGVNAHLRTAKLLPLEFQLLDYTPEPWRQEDCLLVLLSIFQLLNRNMTEERMLSVMHKALPEAVVAFLTPNYDNYTEASVLLGKEPTKAAQFSSIPVQALQQLKQSGTTQSLSGLVDHLSIRSGSNQWVVNKTADGKALVANDMHLPLAVPYIWYQATLHFPEVDITGITLPGLPTILAGSNGHIAWGFTNAQTDALDLVELTLNPADSSQYKTRQGWRDFKIAGETIKVKNAPDRQITIKKTTWGPVSPRLLMDKEVAVHWIALIPNAVNLDLLQMDKVRSLDSALNLLNTAGLPALNATVADERGHIAWTLTGRIPLRQGFDGAQSVSWAEGSNAWAGYVAADAYPRVIDPPSGFLVTANNRVLAGQQNVIEARNYANSYRAFRITEDLQQQKQVTALSMYKLQLDTKAEFFEFYRRLAFKVMPRMTLANDADLSSIRQALRGWDGFANADSIGFGLLVEFRQQLADLVFSPYLQQCRELDKGFRYQWFQMDTPLRQLLTAQLPPTLPGRGLYSNWNDLILTALRQTIGQLQQRYPGADVAQLTWGEMASFQLQHPFSRVYPWLSDFLDMPSHPLVGCVHCVRVSRKHFGASMRMVVTPGREHEMILVGATGQSGHAMSPHYGDQYYYWVNGLLPDSTKELATERLLLIPERN